MEGEVSIPTESFNCHKCQTNVVSCYKHRNSAVTECNGEDGFCINMICHFCLQHCVDEKSQFCKVCNDYRCCFCIEKGDLLYVDKCNECNSCALDCDNE